MEIWTPSNKHQSFQKVLLKLVRTLGTKIRKHYYTFWVHFEANHKKAKSKRGREDAGLEILSGFL
jgi:hypothetical protein